MSADGPRMSREERKQVVQAELRRAMARFVGRPLSETELQRTRDLVTQAVGKQLEEFERAGELVPQFAILDRVDDRFHFGVFRTSDVSQAVASGLWREVQDSTNAK